MSNTIAEIIESYAYEHASPYFLKGSLQITHTELRFLAEVWMLQGGVEETCNFFRVPALPVSSRDTSVIGNIEKIRANKDLYNDCRALSINRLGLELKQLTNNKQGVEQYMSGFYLPDDKELTRIQLYLIVGEIHRTVFKQPYFFESQEYVDDFPTFKRIVSYVATRLVRSGYLYTTPDNFDDNSLFLDFIPK